jgi:hypothetical protein
MTLLISLNYYKYTSGIGKSTNSTEMEKNGEQSDSGTYDTAVTTAIN